MMASLFYESFSTTKKTVTKRPLLSKESEDKFETTLILPVGPNRVLEGGLRTKGLVKPHETHKP